MTTTRMLKADLAARLTEALDRLEALAAKARTKKEDREAAASWVEQVREELARTPARASGGPQTFRIAEVENPETGRTVSVNVRTDGGLYPQAKKLGTSYAKEWAETEAESRPEARAKIEAGDARLMTRTKGGKVKEAEAATA